MSDYDTREKEDVLLIFYSHAFHALLLSFCHSHAFHALHILFFFRSTGDANYRRLLGDRLWDLTAPFQDVVGCYFPCPVCALRTLKAELGCGIEAEEVEKAKALDDAWMTNARFAVVQFGTGAGNE